MGDGYRQALEIVFEQMSLEGTFERKKKKERRIRVENLCVCER